MISGNKKWAGAKRLAVAVPAVAMVSLAAPWLASADSVAVDGDGVDTSNSKNSKFALCAGVGSSVDVFATISFSGTGRGAKHFANGGTVEITTSVPAGAAGFLSAEGASVQTANWNDTNDKVTTAAMKVTVDSDWAAGTYPITYTVSGRDQIGDPYVLTDSNNVQISQAATGCAPADDGGGGEQTPPNTAPTVDVTGFLDGASVEIGTPVPTPGCDVADAEDTGESATPSVGALTGLLADYGLGSVTVTCSYTDGGGLVGTDSATYTIVDTGLPSITDLGPTPAAPNGSNNWYTSAVTNTFEAADTGAGFQTLTPKLLSYQITESTGTAEGSQVTVSSGPVYDVAGNTASAINSAPFKVDLSNPLLNVSGAAGGTTFDVCNGIPNRPSFNPSDAISGLDGTEVDTWTAPGTGSGVGTYTYTATATDNAGRFTTETRKFSSVYGSAFTGVHQPINGGATASLLDDDSRFKLGSTVPVKFKLVCGTTPISNAVAKLNVKRADGTPDPGVEEAVSTAASTTGNLFRYDATAGQYIFNLSTKSGYTNPNGTTVSWAAGTYTLSILLDDGSYRSVNINIVR